MANSVQEIGTSGIYEVIPAPGDDTLGLFLNTNFVQIVALFNAIPSQVNADWNASSGLAQILHKPTLGTAASHAVTDFDAAGAAATAQAAAEAASVPYSGAHDDVDLNGYALGGIGALSAIDLTAQSLQSGAANNGVIQCFNADDAAGDVGLFSIDAAGYYGVQITPQSIESGSWSGTVFSCGGNPSGLSLNLYSSDPITIGINGSVITIGGGSLTTNHLTIDSTGICTDVPPMLHGFTTQMPPPLPPSCTVQSGSGLSAGNYRYVATMIQYYPGNGQGETPPSAASSTLTTTSGNEQIAVTLPALPPGLDAYNIYRTKHGGSGTYYLVASSLSPGTYVDSTPDSSLVTPVSSANTTGAGQITGSMSPTGGPRLVNFSVSGTATLLVPFNGPAYKRVMLYVTSG